MRGLILFCAAAVFYGMYTNGELGTGPVSSYSGGQVASASEIRGLLADAGFPASDLDELTAIALAESSGDMGAVNTSNRNGSTDYCFMQVNSVHGYDPDRLLSDPEYCAAAAYEVYQERDGNPLTAWSTYNNGAYLAHLG